MHCSRQLLLVGADNGRLALTMDGSCAATMRAFLSLQEEAVEVTGKTDPQAAAETILSRPSTSTEWCIVKMGGKGAVLVTKAGEVHHAPAFQVGPSSAS